jgi:hypothetical protein
VLNGKLAYRVATGPSLVAGLFAAGENLAGRSYQYRPGDPAPGRVLSAGADVTL